MSAVMGMGAVFGTPKDEPAHAPWLDGEVAHAHFVRSRVLDGLWTDGETSADELEAFRKLYHRYAGDPLRPRQWTQRDVRDFEQHKSASWADGGLRDEGTDL